MEELKFILCLGTAFLVFDLVGIIVLATIAVFKKPAQTRKIVNAALDFLEKIKEEK